MSIRTAHLRSALFALAVTAGSAGSVVLTGSPAAAALPGTMRLELSSVVDSADKGITVPCPVNTRVINASGYISNGDGSVMMDNIVPNQALTAVTVTGVETDATLNNWSVTAVATCAPAPAGLEWNVQQSIVDSADKSVTATCTGNKQLLGTGGTVKGGGGNVIMDEIKPNGAFGAPSTGVTMWAYEDNPAFAGMWRVITYAICADPLAGQQTLWGVGAWDATNKGWYMKCDPGQVATGTGIEIGTTTDEGEILIDAVYPDGSATTAPTMTTVYAVEEDPVANNWGIMAFVLCVDA